MHEADGGIIKKKEERGSGYGRRERVLLKDNPGIYCLIIRKTLLFTGGLNCESQCLQYNPVLSHNHYLNRSSYAFIA